MSREAMELALEALSFAATPMAKDRQKVLRAQSALREALADQPAQQEQPQRWAVFCAGCRKEWSVPYQHPGKSVCGGCKSKLKAQQQEPVAWMDVEGERVVTAKQKAVMQESIQKSFPNALGYIQPPEPFTLSTTQRKPLTDEEMFRAVRNLYATDELAQLALQTSKDEYRAIEAAHGIGDIV